ncbi:MAG: SDR family oxidoreductase [Fusobacterium perfoetens]|uniref:SDR family oxidoreductase n=1 Tax=Fusobacterium perfoetens TaxID=852 RepID=UPI0023EFBE26|nr:SDR family oxidoreductase [Fusobacterium perfoetens]MCI6151690.1 SDR family oxidoreductase [Fusobacterium perfoetens]MDY3236554.1 SDR family oxidoreductase [Fusobacterium perfoetens]
MKKLVVITGASSGIGMDLAKSFSNEGHPVLMIARRKEIMENLELPETISKSVDVVDYENMEKAIREAEEKYGKTDLLVNCAGVMLLGHPDTQSYEEWERMIDVNVKGILTGTKVVLKDMMERNEGTIINISSIAGRKTFDNHSVYCGSKFAVHAITESMRKEVSDKNVRIIVISPGVVETNLLSHTTDEEIKDNYNDWKKSIESGLDVKQITDCVMFAYKQPQSVCVREIVIAKTKQAD